MDYGLAVSKRSPSRHDDFEIFTWHDHGTITRQVHLADQCEYVARERLLARRVERLECFKQRPVILAKDGEEVLRLVVAEVEPARLGQRFPDAAASNA